jgi:hypothetical protein
LFHLVDSPAEPYLPVVMSHLVNAAGTKADIFVSGMPVLGQCEHASFAEEDEENIEERESWETLQLNEQTGHLDIREVPGTHLL